MNKLNKITFIKVFLFLSVLVINLSAENPIENAILKSDLGSLIDCLKNRPPLSSLEKIKFLDLAQEKIDEVKHKIVMDEFRPFIPEKSVFGIFGILFSPLITFIYFTGPHSYERDGLLMPIMISSIAHLLSLYGIIKGNQEQIEYYKALGQLKEDSLKIKQMIYDA
jgi:hypothetical protein